MGRRKTRRQFLHASASIAAAAAAAAAEGRSPGPPKLPAIRLGKLEVSRLVLGSNPFFGFAHQPGDLSRRMREYYTDERVTRVLDDAAEHGITAVWTPCYDGWIRLWNRYQERGGKLKIWIGQPDDPADKLKDAIVACAKNGGKAACIQGERIDEQFRAGRLAPKDAFAYVLSRLKAKDGLCVGVFPKDADHVGEDTGLVRELSAEKRAGG